MMHPNIATVVVRERKPTIWISLTIYIYSIWEYLYKFKRISTKSKFCGSSF